MLHSRTMVKFMVRPERPLSSTHDTHDTAPRRATRRYTTRYTPHTRAHPPTTHIAKHRYTSNKPPWGHAHDAHISAHPISTDRRPRARESQSDTQLEERRRAGVAARRHRESHLR